MSEVQEWLSHWGAPTERDRSSLASALELALALAEVLRAGAAAAAATAGANAASASAASATVAPGTAATAATATEAAALPEEAGRMAHAALATMTQHQLLQVQGAVRSGCRAQVQVAGCTPRDTIPRHLPLDDCRLPLCPFPCWTYPHPTTLARV